MMKILHSAGIYKPSSGIAQQMAWEKQAANAIDLPWHVELCVPERTAKALDQYQDILYYVESTKKNAAPSLLTGWLAFQKLYYMHLLSIQHQYDVLLVRYNTHDPWLPWFLSQTRKPVLTVHHTLEGPELRSSHSLSGYARSVADWIVSFFVLRQASGILAVTSEIAEYETTRSRASIPWIFFPNGYFGESSALPMPETSVHEVIFVASKFAPWQGLDRLLAALCRSTSSIVIHIVGELTDEQQVACNKDSRIQTHGLCNHKQITSLSKRCSAGLSAFALEREGMKIGCTLKVRQYLAVGLPVYAGHRDIFPDEVVFYHVGQCDIDHIIAYCDRMREYTRRSIIDKAWSYISKTHILQKAYDDINNALKNGKKP